MKKCPLLNSNCIGTECMWWRLPKTGDNENLASCCIVLIKRALLNPKKEEEEEVKKTLWKKEVKPQK